MGRLLVVKGRGLSPVSSRPTLYLSFLTATFTAVPNTRNHSNTFIMNPSNSEISDPRDSDSDIELTNTRSFQTKTVVQTSQTDLASHSTDSVHVVNEDASEHENTVRAKLNKRLRSLFHKHELDTALERPHLAGK